MADPVRLHKKTENEKKNINISIYNIERYIVQIGIICGLILFLLLFLIIAFMLVPKTYGFFWY